MRNKFLICFILINSLLAGYYIDTWNNANTTSRMLAVLNVVTKGSFNIDLQNEKTIDKVFIKGHYYSDKAPLPVFLVIPFYKLLTISGYQENGEGKAIYILGSIICGIIPFLIILLLCLKAATKSNAVISPVVLSMLPLYGSFIFIYSSTFYNHLLSAMFLLLSYVYIRKERAFIAGLFIGLSFLSEFSVSMVIGIWVIQLFCKRKSINEVIRFACGVLPSVIVIMVYNYIFTGSVFTMLYKYHQGNFSEMSSAYGFSYPKLKALWGITFSQYRGLFIYAPFILFYLFYLIQSALSLSPGALTIRILRSYSALAGILVILMISSYFCWWGGWTFGPRLLLFIAVLLVYKGIDFLASKQFSKIALWGILLFGLILSISAKITVIYSIPTEVAYPFKDGIWPSLVNANFNPNSVISMLFGIAPATAAILFVFLFILGTFLLFKMQSNFCSETNLNNQTISNHPKCGEEALK